MAVDQNLGKDNGGRSPLGRPVPLGKMLAAMSGRPLCAVQDELCGTETFAPHTCPFQTEINEDYDYLCRCCGACEHGCNLDT